MNGLVHLNHMKTVIIESIWRNLVTSTYFFTFIKVMFYYDIAAKKFFVRTMMMFSFCVKNYRQKGEMQTF